MKRTDHIAHNIDLAFRFLSEVADDPAILEQIDSCKALVLLPPDDPPQPELTVANTQLARRLAEAGHEVIMWAVESPSAKGPRVLGRWPILPNSSDPVITYDRDRDVLAVDLVTTERPAMLARSASPAVLRVDPETRIIVGFTVPRFLAAAAPKSMLLFDLLLRPAARLHGITLGELHGIREAMVHGGRRIKSTPLTTDEIARELARLSA
jgi:hypothetical protein